MTDMSVRQAVQKMSEMMANLYYHLTREMLETYGEEAKEVIARAVVAFGRERGEAIAQAVQEAGEELTI